MDEFLRARSEIRAGALRGEALRERILAVPRGDREGWVDAVLGIEATPADIDLPRGSVPYLPCGVDEILAALEAVPVRSTDTFVDLGSGLGRVAILAHLLTGAHAHGIESQPHLVRCARERCEGLGLSRVSFTQGDAAETELDGTVFFLYAPFNGTMLQRVLQRLHDVAERHAIEVCAVDLELHGLPLMRRRSGARAPLAIYDASHLQAKLGGHL